MFALSGCTPNAAYRTDPTSCHAGPCAQSALEIHADGPAPFALGFVEFDDQGRAFDARQERSLFDFMAATARTTPLAIITFVHGWQHNARAEDGNVVQFRQLLTAIARYEATQPDGRRRAVVGVYTGWRGLSIDAPYLQTLSFWTRKDAAHRVAEGSLRSLIGELRAFRDLSNRAADRDGSNPRRETRMLTIGHSFGGLIVYSALAQYWTDRAAASLIQSRYFANKTTGQASGTDDLREIPSYGDLVVVVNPAYEAMRYEPVRQLLDHQQTGKLPARFAPRQGPVLVQITSVGDTAFQGDWATGVAFPIGRALNTFTQPTRADPVTGDDERQQIERAVGHYQPYWTHDLDRPQGPELANAATLYDPNAACRSFREFDRTARGADGRLKPGWTRTYLSGAVLTEIGQGRYDPANPFWIVRAHPSIILDHNDIIGPVFVDFVAQLYGDIDRLRHRSLCDTSR